MNPLTIGPTNLQRRFRLAARELVWLLPAAWIAMHLVSTRWSWRSVAHDGPIVAQWGFPMPWAQGSIATSMSFDLSLAALLVNLSFYALALWIVATPLRKMPPLQKIQVPTAAKGAALALLWFGAAYLIAPVFLGFDRVHLLELPLLPILTGESYREASVCFASDCYQQLAQ